MEKTYDLIIIGGGPAGLAAAIYAGRSQRDTLVVEKGGYGGRVKDTGEIRNYPGTISDSGQGLMEKFHLHAQSYPTVEFCRSTVTGIRKEKGLFTVDTKRRGSFTARSVILALGTKPRELGIPGEKEFVGHGVAYCATCDASFFEDLEVFVVGGGDSAVEEAMYLTKFARKVTVIHRRDELRAAKSIQERAFKNPKLFFMWDTVVEELHGDGILSGMTVKNVKTGELTRIDADEDDGLFGVFGFIGYNPRSELFEGKLEMDRGYIKTDEDMHTNVEGVYAVGDIRVKSLRQVVTAAADGAIASMQVERWLAEQK